MNLTTAARQTEVLSAAIQYANNGLSVVPLWGKTARVPWDKYKSQRADAMTIMQWHRNHHLSNVGIVCGAVSGGLVVVDLDGQAAVNAWHSRYRYETFTVKTGNGEHVYFIVDEPTLTTRVIGNRGNIEVRSDGAYVVAPPSIHPTTGEPYKIKTWANVLRLPTLSPVSDWLNDLKSRRSVPQRPAQPHKARVTARLPENYVRAYVRASVERECNHVRSAPNGDRNNSLFHAARRLGALVASPDVPPHQRTTQIVENELTKAAAGLARDDGMRSVLSTIASGLRRGLKEPYDLPEPRIR